MIYVSVDVEASGPLPGLFSLVSLGAVPVVRRREGWVVDEERTFYAELQPLEGAGELAEATRVHGLGTKHLRQHGLPPAEAMRRFAEFWSGLAGARGRVTAAAWPASFDAPFIGWYCQRFLGYNPVGHSAFDIASYAMGLFRCSRADLRRRMKKAGIVAPRNPNPHNALADAVEQGHLLAMLLQHATLPAPPEAPARGRPRKGSKKP